jgi:DNA-binding CsgD family transcriptional regulator
MTPLAVVTAPPERPLLPTGTLDLVLHGRPGSSAVMIGRADALAHLVDLVDAADVIDGDQPAVALVAGEAGIGKTRLVRELLTAAGPSVPAFTILAEPGSIGRAHGAMGSFATAVDPAQALVDAIATAVTTGPALLIVEDLHWIDAESAAAVDLIARQAWPRLVIVGTYRPADLARGAPGGELVVRLERRHAVEQVRLERLDRNDVGRLITSITRAQPSSAVVEAVDRRSGGVPFVIEELVRCCGPDTLADDVLTAELPWSLEEAVRQQVIGLGADERVVVEALAVYGRAIDFDTLLDLVALDEQTVVVALRDLIDRDVVIESVDERFWFTHALMADAIVHQLMGRERRRLHERCFEAERARPGADAGMLARHAAGAGRYDEIVAIARRGAPAYLVRGAAFQALRLAADALAEAPDDPLLLGVATEAAWRLDFDAEAIATATRWAAVATTDDDRIEAQRLLGRLRHEQGDDAGRRAAVQRLRTMVDELAAPAVRARAAAAIAQLCMLGGESSDAVRWADQAIVDGHAAGAPAIVARARVERASARAGRVPRSESVEEFNDALAAVRAIGDPVVESRALNNMLEVVPPHSPVGRTLIAELFEVTGRSGFDKLGIGPVSQWQVRAATGAGDMPAVRRAMGGGRTTTSASPYVREAMTIAVLAIEDGRFDDARRWFDDHAVVTYECPKSAVVSLGLRIDAGQGDTQAARRSYAHLLATTPPGDDVFLLDSAIDIVEAALSIGIDPVDVRRDLETWFAAHPSSGDVIRHVDGVLALAEGRPEDAASSLRAIVDEPDERLSRPVLGSLRTSLAAALLAVGDRAAAIAAVTEALTDDLARWPGVRRDRAEALLRRLQGSSSRADGELTSREREVASLLVHGLTNGQLAERLFISPKTAAVHVSNILTKLGLSSRAEIAAWAVRNGLELSVAS